MDLYSGLKSMTENVRRSAANEPGSVDGPMFPLIFSRYLSFAPTSPDKKRREIWGTPYCFARKDVGDPTGYLTLLLPVNLVTSGRAVVMVAMVATMVMGLSKRGRAKQQDQREQQSLFHAPIIPPFRRLGFHRVLLFWVTRHSLRNPASAGWKKRTPQ